MIVNPSSKTFSVYEFKLLNKGLNFCPTPAIYSNNEFTNDFKQFSRKIKHKAHFGDHTDTTTSENREFKPETDKTWEPKCIHHKVKTFVVVLERDLSEFPMNNDQNKFIQKYLSKSEKLALQKLKSRDDIIITKTDKGGASAILNIEDNIAEAQRQKNDTTY